MLYERNNQTNNDSFLSTKSEVEVCKSDPIGFRNENIHFGLDRIDKVWSDDQSDLTVS
jgi:hypothetical protein